MAQGLEGPALVGFDHEQLDGVLGVVGMDPVDGGRAGLDVGQGPRHGLGVGDLTVVEGDGGGLDLELGAGGAGGDPGQVDLDAGPQVLLALAQLLAEAEVELGAVAADQVDLGGQAGEQRQVT